MPVVSKQQQQQQVRSSSSSSTNPFIINKDASHHHLVAPDQKNQAGLVPVPSMKEIKFQLQEMFAQSAGKHNLHSQVLHDFAKLTFVPHPTKNSNFNFHNQFTNDMPIAEQQQLRNPNNLPTKCVFVGQLPLVIKAGEIAWIFFVVLGSLPISVSPVTHSSASTNANGKVTSIMFKVELPVEDVQPAIARLNCRLFPDQTGYHLAKTQEEARTMRQYQKMLERNPAIRFNHRPRSPITVVEEKDSSPSSSTDMKNLPPFNPMCDCSACQAFMKENVNFDFLDNVYLPQVTGTCDNQLKQGFFKFVNNNNNTMNRIDSQQLNCILENYIQATTFKREHMVRCHGFLSKTHDLTTERDKKAYSAVSDTALKCCQDYGVNYWPFWKFAEHESDFKELNCSRCTI